MLNRMQNGVIGAAHRVAASVESVASTARRFMDERARPALLQVEWAAHEVRMACKHGIKIEADLTDNPWLERFGIDGKVSAKITPLGPPDAE